jgi:hypothetical protein
MRRSWTATPSSECKPFWMPTGRAGSASKKHSHYLNGSVFCRVCGARLGYGKHRGKCGGQYDYYSCLSRVRPSGPCGNPHAPVERVEQVVAALHADRPWLNEHEQTVLREAIRDSSLPRLLQRKPKPNATANDFGS